MTKSQLECKIRAWAARVGADTADADLDRAVTVLTYDAGETSETLTGVAVQSIAVHTNRVHVLLFTERTTWQKDEDGSATRELSAAYRLLLSF